MASEPGPVAWSYVGSEFFPPLDSHGTHDDIKELKDRTRLRKDINTGEDYRAAYARGFRWARDYLFRLPSQTPWLNPRQTRRAHHLLYLDLYPHAGEWTPTVGTFGGRAGADPVYVETELELLARQSASLVVGWRHPADSEEGIIERMTFIAFYHARFILVHPFRDGNGRTARLIAQWQEWCLFGPIPRREIPRGIYMAAMEGVTENFAVLVNSFGYRHHLPTRFIETLEPPFPVRVTCRG